MKIEVTEIVTQCSTIEVPDTLNSWAEIALEVERQRTTRDDIKRDTAVTGVEWSHRIESNEDIVKNLELFKPDYVWIPPSSVTEEERGIWLTYMNGALVRDDRHYHYSAWQRASDPQHSPAAVLELILKERGE